MLVDSHTHLYLDEFLPDKKAAVNRAVEAGIGHMMFPNVDISTIGPMKELAKEFPGRIDMAMGLHPTEVNTDYEAVLHVVEAELKTGSYRAVGEIGMDLYWDDTYIREQSIVFRKQCEMAVSAGLPIIIHCRNALEPILNVFEQLDTIPRGVFHSFGGTAEDVSRILEYGDFYFGINGIVTFKNSKTREVLPEIGLDRILLETDSPYLAPVPMRGKRNESSFMIHIAAYIADSMNIPLTDVADITSTNYFSLFGES